jgi:hypothetical protein
MSGTLKPTKDQWYAFLHLAQALRAEVTLRYNGDLLDGYIVVTAGPDFSLLGDLTGERSAMLIAVSGVTAGTMKVFPRPTEEPGGAVDA